MADGVRMFSSSKFNSFFPIIIVALVFFLSSCSERSEYGKRSDYEKFGSATTVTSGSGTIKGTVISQSASSALSGVSVSYALSGTTVATTTTDSSGDFTQSSLATGTYTLSYSNSGYVDETQSATLSTDGQTLKVTTLKMLSNSCASTGTISGKITDAVSSANVSGVSISARRGLNFTSGTVIGTDTTG